MSDKQEVRIGNCLDLLKEMPSESIDVVVTSPTIAFNREQWDELAKIIAYADLKIRAVVQ